MYRRILVGIGVATLTGATAHAQFSVIDPANLAQAVVIAERTWNHWQELRRQFETIRRIVSYCRRSSCQWFQVRSAISTACARFAGSMTENCACAVAPVTVAITMPARMRRYMTTSVQNALGVGPSYSGS